MKIYDNSKNYTATVIELPPKQRVEGLDNLMKVTVFGNDVLVGRDEEPDQLYLFFPSGTQLSQEFCKNNNLFRDAQLNLNPDSKGFFEPNGRVKAIKFKGVISTGFIIPASSLTVNGMNLDFLGLKIGDEFNEINGQLICEKYVRKYLHENAAKGDKVAKINNRMADLMIPNQFRFHDETSQLARNLHMFKPDDIIAITDKWHGSSCILSKVLINRKLTRWQKLLNWLGGEVPDRKYAYIYSSGKPKSNLPKGIEGEWINDNTSYYISNIWKRAFDDYKETLEDGISLYGELVGFTEGGSPIQGGYDYGCLPTKYKFVVYRITYTKPDGNVIEFSWQQVKDYCIRRSLEHVQEIYFGKLFDFDEVKFRHHDTETYADKLMSILSDHYINGDCGHCTNDVPKEGVVVRIDGKDKFNAFKLKSKTFLKQEDEQLDVAVNMEDEGNNT